MELLENKRTSSPYMKPSKPTSLITNLELHTRPEDVFDNHIPQLDGIELVKDNIKCENCRELFGTRHLLEKHVEDYEYICEECSSCFKTQYDYDLHEYSEHQEDYFKYNQVTPTTKLQRTRILASGLP